MPLLTAFCGLLSALTVFTYMGFMSKLTGVDISDIPLAGPDLLFIVFPSALTYMSFPNFWSVLFFIIMVLLGIDT